ncbi:MAG: glycoside hydrolase family protein, partial [Actinomycetota bacterium]|nr:glycoside hydrolase family protein [Actinomycetota bacterium]
PPDCGALATRPAPRAGGWRARGRTPWGGAPIKHNRTYHMFASLNRWGTVDTWPNSSVVVHATSPTAAGPDTEQSVVLGNRSADFFDGSATQNPGAIVLHDGSVALFYVGLSCTMRAGGYTARDCEDSANSSLGVAHAPTPWGPWTRMDTSILATERPVNHEGDALANPAVIQEDDGSLLIAYRGRHDEVLPLATAPHWSGPYTRVLPPGSSSYPSGCSSQVCNDTICFDAGHAKELTGSVHDISRPAVGPFKCLEDPFILRLASGSYHMIMHNQGEHSFSGAHGFSADGKNWSLSPTAAYSLTVEMDDGSKLSLYRREEPKLLVDEGFATHLFNAACPTPQDCGEVLAVPLEPIALWNRSSTHHKSDDGIPPPAVPTVASPKISVPPHVKIMTAFGYDAAVQPQFCTHAKHPNLTALVSLYRTKGIPGLYNLYCVGCET